jgi:hypothetical protein
MDGNAPWTLFVMLLPYSIVADCNDEPIDFGRYRVSREDHTLDFITRLYYRTGHYFCVSTASKNAKAISGLRRRVHRYSKEMFRALLQPCFDSALDKSIQS